jgi:hypothetical protein
MVNLVYPDRSEADGCRDLMPENGGFGVPLVRVDKHARENLVAEEGLAVGEMGGRLAGVARSIVPGRDESVVGRCSEYREGGCTSHLRSASLWRVVRAWWDLKVAVAVRRALVRVA